jgi:hypothetical protein
MSPTASASNSQMQLYTASTSAQPDQMNTVAISVHDNRSSCPIWCGCSCHARKSISLFDILFVSYSASQFRSRKCSERSCKSGPTGFRARLTYYFPRILLCKALAIHIGMNQYNEPAFSLTVRNVVRGDARIFYAAQNGDVETLKVLLESRRAHPNDIDVDTGETALHVSILYVQKGSLRRKPIQIATSSDNSSQVAVASEQFTAASLLISAGANPNIEDHIQMSLSLVSFHYTH